jgi:hypothetical protein
MQQLVKKMLESLKAEFSSVEKNDGLLERVSHKRFIQNEVQGGQITSGAKHSTHSNRNVWLVISKVDKKGRIPREKQLQAYFLENGRWSCRCDTEEWSLT